MEFLVIYDCGESALVTCKTAEEAWLVMDDLGCAPVEVIPADDVEISEVWNKNGILRPKWKRVSDG